MGKLLILQNYYKLLKLLRCEEEKLTHWANQNDTLDLDPLVLQESSQQLHPRPTYMEVKLLKITTVCKYAWQLYKNIITYISCHWRKKVQYFQKSEKQCHMFRVLNEPVCELGSQVISLFLGILICKGDERLKFFSSEY